MSRHLIRAADGLETLSVETIDKTVMKVEVPPATPPAQPLVTVVAPVPSKPTPLDVAAIGRQAATSRSSVLAYSTTTGGGQQVVVAHEDPAKLAEQIDLVVTNVLTAFRKSETFEALAELQAGRPSIPRDIDKVASSLRMVRTLSGRSAILGCRCLLGLTRGQARGACPVYVALGVRSNPDQFGHFADRLGRSSLT